jgi:hypothetical protein
VLLCRGNIFFLGLLAFGFQGVAAGTLVNSDLLNHSASLAARHNTLLDLIIYLLFNFFRSCLLPLFRFFLLNERIVSTKTGFRFNPGSVLVCIHCTEECEDSNN